MTISEFTAFINFYYEYSNYCIAHPVSWVGCGKFWGIVYLSVITVLLYVCYKLIRFIYRERKVWNDFIKRQEERAKVADEETMSNHKWNADF